MDNRQILSEIVVQLAGFGIVFWVLKKLAWGKLLGAIDQRRKAIEDTFADLEKKKQGFDDLENEYRRRIEHIEEAARAKIQEAATAGTALAKDIQEKARHDAQKMIQRAEAEIEQDIQRARISMRDQIVDLSGLMAEKVIQERLDAKEHEKLVDKFLKELEKVG